MLYYKATETFCSKIYNLEPRVSHEILKKHFHDKFYLRPSFLAIAGLDRVLIQKYVADIFFHIEQSQLAVNSVGKDTVPLWRKFFQLLEFAVKVSENGSHLDQGIKQIAEFDTKFTCYGLTNRFAGAYAPKPFLEALAVEMVVRGKDHAGVDHRSSTKKATGGDHQHSADAGTVDAGAQRTSTRVVSSKYQEAEYLLKTLYFEKCNQLRLANYHALGGGRGLTGMTLAGAARRSPAGAGGVNARNSINRTGASSSGLLWRNSFSLSPTPTSNRVSVSTSISRATALPSSPNNAASSTSTSTSPKMLTTATSTSPKSSTIFRRSPRTTRSCLLRRAFSQDNFFADDLVCCGGEVVERQDLRGIAASSGGARACDGRRVEKYATEVQLGGVAQATGGSGASSSSSAAAVGGETLTPRMISDLFSPPARSKTSSSSSAAGACQQQRSQPPSSNRANSKTGRIFPSSPSMIGGGHQGQTQSQPLYPLQLTLQAKMRDLFRELHQRSYIRATGEDELGESISDDLATPSGYFRYPGGVLISKALVEQQLRIDAKKMKLLWLLWREAGLGTLTLSTTSSCVSSAQTARKKAGRTSTASSATRGGTSKTANREEDHGALFPNMRKQSDLITAKDMLQLYMRSYFGLRVGSIASTASSDNFEPEQHEVVEERPGSSSAGDHDHLRTNYRGDHLLGSDDSADDEIAEKIKVLLQEVMAEAAEEEEEHEQAESETCDAAVQHDLKVTTQTADTTIQFLEHLREDFRAQRMQLLYGTKKDEIAQVVENLISDAMAQVLSSRKSADVLAAKSNDHVEQDSRAGLQVEQPDDCSEELALQGKRKSSVLRSSKSEINKRPDEIGVSTSDAEDHEVDDDIYEAEVYDDVAEKNEVGDHDPCCTAPADAGAEGREDKFCGELQLDARPSDISVTTAASPTSFSFVRKSSSLGSSTCCTTPSTTKSSKGLTSLQTPMSVDGEGEGTLSTAGTSS
ncbi:unnamed protein product [Amoebophrya sp. A120]|nr:unnamed protein product [Amoebophrya sp. A120]|eukprot:GSA120T00014346001.1